MRPAAGAVGRADQRPAAASRNAACSSALIAIWSRRLTGGGLSGKRARRRRERLGGGADRRARVLGLEHDRVAGLLEHLAHEPVDAGEAELDDHRAVVELGDHGPLLARPPRALGRDPDARAARGGDLAGPRPAVDVGRRIHVRARLEVLVGDRRRLDPVQAEVADARRAPGRSWPRTSPRGR